jgi:quinol-cytochrome oxidoreductase complex cytochrome b subunit
MAVERLAGRRLELPWLSGSVVRKGGELGIVLSSLVGGFSKAWWHVVAGAIFIGSIIEMLLVATQVTRPFNPIINPIIWAIGVIAAVTWAALFFTGKRWWQARK